MSENFYEQTKDLSAEALMYLLQFKDTRESILKFSENDLLKSFPENRR